MTTRYTPDDIAFARAVTRRHNNDRHFRLPAGDLATLRAVAAILPDESHRATPTELAAFAAIRERIEPATLLEAA